MNHGQLEPVDSHPLPYPPHAPLTLHPVEPSDLDHFYRHEADPASRHAAAFMPAEPPARPDFDAFWARILASPAVTARTIRSGDAVGGHIASFHRDADREVTDWIDPALRSRWDGLPARLFGKPTGWKPVPLEDNAT